MSLRERPTLPIVPRPMKSQAYFKHLELQVAGDAKAGWNRPLGERLRQELLRRLRGWTAVRAIDPTSRLFVRYEVLGARLARVAYEVEVLRL